MPEAQVQKKRIKPESKKPIANARVGILDKETGEVIDDGDLIYVPKKIRIKGFFMGMQLGFEHITRFKLNGEALNVLLFMISRMDYENYIRVSQKEVADALGMKKQNVSRAVRILRKFSIIDPGEHNSQRLSLEIGWKGKVSNMRKEQTRQELDSTRQRRDDAKKNWAEEKSTSCEVNKSGACPTKEASEIAP